MPSLRHAVRRGAQPLRRVGERDERAAARAQHGVGRAERPRAAPPRGRRPPTASCWRSARSRAQRRRASALGHEHPAPASACHVRTIAPRRRRAASSRSLPAGDRDRAAAAARTQRRRRPRARPPPPRTRWRSPPTVELVDRLGPSRRAPGGARRAGSARRPRRARRRRPRAGTAAASRTGRRGCALAVARAGTRRRTSSAAGSSAPSGGRATAGSPRRARRRRSRARGRIGSLAAPPPSRRVDASAPSVRQRVARLVGREPVEASRGRAAATRVPGKWRSIVSRHTATGSAVLGLLVPADARRSAAARPRPA